MILMLLFFLDDAIFFLFVRVQCLNSFFSFRSFNGLVALLLMKVDG